MNKSKNNRKSVLAQSNPVSSSVSDEQTFFDRISLIVRQLNNDTQLNPFIQKNPFIVEVENGFHIKTQLYILANDLALIQLEFGAVDIWLHDNCLCVSGEITYA